ncbi:hypothetical protein ACH4TV_02580 [Streptomyces sp. NPDC020898]|uniref:hypothetical protein n=1 Tax=Streptomyces sp. NPDC020898 TaxID=3365101 RepID=UPI00378F0896
MLDHLEANAQCMSVDQLIPVRDAAQLSALSDEELARPAFLPADEDGGDPEHKECREAAASAAHLVVTSLVLAELVYLLSTRISPEAAQGALAHVRDRVAVRRYAVPEIEPHLSTALVTMRRYPQIGLTDTLNVVMAAKYHTDSMAGRRGRRRPLVAVQKRAEPLAPRESRGARGSLPRTSPTADHLTRTPTSRSTQTQ